MAEQTCLACQRAKQKCKDGKCTHRLFFLQEARHGKISRHSGSSGCGEPDSGIFDAVNRIADPIHGSLGVVNGLQQRVTKLQEELELYRQTYPPPPPPPGAQGPPPPPPPA